MKKIIILLAMIIMLSSLVYSLPPIQICCSSSSSCVYCGYCYSNGAKVDVDNNGDLDVCKSGTWGDCNGGSGQCPSGETCISGDCKKVCSTASGGACEGYQDAECYPSSSRTGWVYESAGTTYCASTTYGNAPYCMCQDNLCAGNSGYSDPVSGDGKICCDTTEITGGECCTSPDSCSVLHPLGGWACNQFNSCYKTGYDCSVSYSTCPAYSASCIDTSTNPDRACCTGTYDYPTFQYIQVY